MRVEPQVRLAEHPGGLVFVEEVEAHEERSTARRSASVNRAVTWAGQAINYPSIGRQLQDVIHTRSASL